MLSKSLLSIFILFVTLIKTYAQVDSASFKLIYEKEVIYFSGNKYIKNSTSYPLKKLETEFKPNTEGFELFQMSLSDRKKSRIYSIISLGSFISGIIVGRNNPDLGLTFILGSIVPTGISLNLSIKADKKMRKSIWLRNRDILLQRN